MIPVEEEGAATKQEILIRHSRNLPPSILIDAGYDVKKKVAQLKFYDPKTQEIFTWYDDTGHKPYCLTKMPPDSLHDLKNRKDVVEINQVLKHDLINDSDISMTKIIGTSPGAIGGEVDRGPDGDGKNIRDTLRSIEPHSSYESEIPYQENFMYDRNLIPGTYYQISDSKIQPVEFEVSETMRESLKQVLDRSSEDYRSSILDWARLLNQPLPELKRVALDIEVYTEEGFPNAEDADYPVIAVGLAGSDETAEVYVLEREGIEEGDQTLDNSIRIYRKKNEEELLRSVFSRILDYPILLTYNGDDFDLKYLFNRAKKKNISQEEIPITLAKLFAHLKHGVHIDLYRTFINRSIQIYAFGNKYSEHTLNAISQSLINESKIKFEGSLNDLSYNELARYCYNDALITFRLTQFSDSILMKLLLVISRVARMPLFDVSRLSVSNWIRNLLFFEHRRTGALIPTTEDIEKKGGSDTNAIIKGKKYKGGLVVEPKSGIHFEVAVLDFASLYPSIIKVHNLSYETIRCPHEECKSQTIPETNYWICKKRTGLTSLVIGSLRDLRVNYYKPLAKNQLLSQDEKSLQNVISQALKVILNASYGVMGYEKFSLYCLPVADATATLGRNAIQRTIEKAEEMDIEVLYGDTDSLFLKSPSEQQLTTITQWADKELDIELDLEKVFRYVAFSDRKKNYLGVRKDGTVDIKGMTGKKRHTPPFIKKAFQQAVTTLSRVTSPHDFEKSKQQIREDARDRYQALKRKEIPIEELAFNVMMSRQTSQYKGTIPQHVRAAKLLEGDSTKDKADGVEKYGKITTQSEVNNHVKEIKAGTVVSYVKTTSKEGVKPTSMARVEEIDTDKYLEYLEATFDQLLDSMGISFSEIKGDTKLEDFFWGKQS